MAVFWSHFRDFVGAQKIEDLSESKNFFAKLFQITSRFVLAKKKLGVRCTLSGLHTANLSWQTRVGKLQRVDKLFPSHVKLVSNEKHGTGNLQHDRLFSAVVLTYNSEKEEKKQKAVRKWKGLDETKFVRTLLRFVLFVFSIFVGYR